MTWVGCWFLQMLVFTEYLSVRLGHLEGLAEKILGGLQAGHR